MNKEYSTKKTLELFSQMADISKVVKIVSAELGISLETARKLVERDIYEDVMGENVAI